MRLRLHRLDRYREIKKTPQAFSNNLDLSPAALFFFKGAAAQSAKAVRPHL